MSSSSVTPAHSNLMPAPPVLSRISDYAHHYAVRAGASTAVRLGGTALSYARLAEEIDATALALLALGVRKGDRVATLQTPRPEFFTAFLATASIGAVWVGLNPRYRLGELLAVIRDARPRVLLTRASIDGRSYRGDLEAIAAELGGALQIVVFEGEAAVAAARSHAEFIAGGASVSHETLSGARHDCGGRDPCLIVYTSGTTGAPKGAVLHHAGLVRFSLAQNVLWPLNPVRVLNYFPINHVGCVADMACPALVAGGEQVFLEHFDVEASLHLMAEWQVTLWGSVPSVFQMQLASPACARTDFSSVQLIVWEGAAMPRDDIVRLRRICPSLATNYGMSETTSAVTVVEPTDNLDVLADSVGFPFPGVEVRLADRDGLDAALGQPGELWARSDLNMLGYWSNPTATAEALSSDGWLRTGDLAVRRPDGRYRIVGRIKEMYKSGGYNVYPREIESVLEQHPAVAAVAVTAASDPLWQEVGVAFVVARGSITEEELIAWCHERLANYKVPKRVVFLDSLPLLPIGKVDRQALRLRALQGTPT